MLCEAGLRAAWCRVWGGVQGCVMLWLTERQALTFQGERLITGVRVYY
jgi:hypothetical protein